MSCTGAQRGQLFLPSSFSGALEFSFISNNFPFNLCLLAASFLLFVLHVWKEISDNVPTWFSERCLEFMWENCLSQVFTKDFAQKRSRPICQICCKVVPGVWGRAHRCSAGHGQQFIHWHRLGMCLRCLTILCYFDSCHLKENKTAAVIRVGQKAVFILAE